MNCKTALGLMVLLSAMGASACEAVMGDYSVGAVNKGPLTCDQAVASAYAMGCTMTTGGSNAVAMGQADAVSQCETQQAAVANGTCPCSSEFTAEYECLNSIGANQCDSCSSVMQSWNVCVAANCAGGSPGDGGSSSALDASGHADGGVLDDATSVVIGDGATSTVNATACGQCMLQYCASQATACYGNTACENLLTCYGTCTSDSTSCVSTCNTTYSTGVTLMNPLLTCAMTSCTSQCG